MAELSFKTVNASAKSEVFEQDSKFIAVIRHVKSDAEAKKVISELKKEHLAAKHICYAYRLFSEKNKNKGEKVCDDGEPQGTGGPPILSVLKNHNIGNAIIAVVRYFGGTLLGISLLAKTYGLAAEKVVKNSVLTEVSYLGVYEIVVSYSDVKKIETFAKNEKIKVLDIEYLEDVVIKLAFSQDKKKKTEEALGNALNRKAQLKFIETKFV